MGGGLDYLSLDTRRYMSHAGRRRKSPPLGAGMRGDDASGGTADLGTSSKLQERSYPLQDSDVDRREREVRDGGGGGGFE